MLWKIDRVVAFEHDMMVDLRSVGATGPTMCIITVKGPITVYPISLQRLLHVWESSFSWQEGKKHQRIHLRCLYAASDLLSDAREIAPSGHSLCDLCLNREKIILVSSLGEFTWNFLRWEEADGERVTPKHPMMERSELKHCQNTSI